MEHQAGHCVSTSLLLSVEGGGITTHIDQLRHTSRSLLFLGDDAVSSSSSSSSSPPTSPWLLSPRTSSESEAGEEEVDMCQLVEDGLLDNIDEGKAALATRILENIDQLMDLEEWIKSEEPFTNWLEDKTMITLMMSPLPTFGEVLPEPVVVTHSHAAAATLPQQQQQQQQQQQTHNLLCEFESVFDSVEELGKQQQQRQRKTATLEQLTPPESPHMAEVEALVRRRAEEHLGVLCDDPPSPSPSNSSNSSYSVGSDTSSPLSSDADYPDVVHQQPLKPCQQRRNRAAPYSGAPRNSSDKRSRKKEQNKNAATRYRQKKKAEVEEIVTEERDLQRRNEHLHADVADVQREIRYLKSLMRDLFKAKGLLK